MLDHERWLPLRQIPDEGGAAGGVAEGDAGGAAEVTPPPSGPGSGRSELRQQLEKNFDTDRKATEKADKAEKKGKAAKRVAGGAEVDAAEAPVAGAEGAEAPVEGAEGTPPQQPAVAAPEGLSAEAKAEWAKTPPTVQQAVAKRLADSAKGVEELKTKYADLDGALAPHMDIIRRHGHTPAQAVSQMFAWFQALAGNPSVAFPALAKSFGHDIAAFMQQQQQQQPTNGVDPAAPAQGGLPPEVQKYISDLQTRVDGLQKAFAEKIGSVENAVQQQSQAKTDEVLNMWAKDKPHFQSVRQLMAHLISSGAVPLKDGQVDLDRAYDMAVWGNPEVRTLEMQAQEEARKKAAADKAAAEKKAQQEQADKARKAAVSVSGAAPGAPGAPGTKPAKKKTVRESLIEAQKELADQ